MGVKGKPFLWVWIQDKYEKKKREAKQTTEWLILLKINILLPEILHGWVRSAVVGPWYVGEKTNQTKKKQFWPFTHNVTGNDRILGMQHNERKQG